MMKQRGFTIVELLVAAVIIVLLTGLIGFVIRQSSSAMEQARSTAQEFGAAQQAFDWMTRRIRCATLNAYKENHPKDGWRRASELRFVSGPMQRLDPEPASERTGHGIFFQAPRDRRGYESDPTLAGLDELLGTWGYFVEVAGWRNGEPGFAPNSEPLRVRPQLMELREPPARLRIYGRTNGKPDYPGIDWLHDSLSDREQAHPIAANIAALVILPRLPDAEAASIAPHASDPERAAMLAPDYFYHSAELGPVKNLDMRHRLPPRIELTMVALDDATVAKNYTIDEPDPFGVQDLFRDSHRLREDLHVGPDSLEGRLIRRRAHYRIFTTVISIHSPP